MATTIPELDVGIRSILVALEACLDGLNDLAEAEFDALDPALPLRLIEAQGKLKEALWLTSHTGLTWQAKVTPRA